MSPRYLDEATLQAREREILDRALDIISTHGIVALTMDKLVASVSFSKGTVYGHFSSKEDVLAGLCNENMQRVATLFSRAVAVEGLMGRERMVSISFAYMLSVLMAPQHFGLVMHAKTEMFEKASLARKEEHDQLDEKLVGVISGVIERAIADKELTLQTGSSVQEVSFSTWAMAFGTIALLLNGEKACSTLTGLMLENRVIAHANIVMDGVGWAKAKNDQNNLLSRLKEEVFVGEMEELGNIGIDLPCQAESG
jgi:AcrR family transcriptional regulator